MYWCHLLVPMLLVTSPVTRPARADCMLDWLRVAGATEEDVAEVKDGGQMLDARMDEDKVSSAREYFLGLILNFKHPLARQMKLCVARSSLCPNASIPALSPCSDDGKCLLNKSTTAMECVCQSGIRGSRCEEDVDECAEGLHDCSSEPLAKCINEHATFYCQCPRGYVNWDRGQSCRDVDECDTGAHDCSHGDALCNNTIGSFTCHCKDGYLGNGRECREAFCAGAADKVLCGHFQRLESSFLDLQATNKLMEKKLHERDMQLRLQYQNLQLVATLMTRQQKRLQALDLDLGERITGMAILITGQQKQLQALDLDLNKRIAAKCTGSLQSKSFVRTGTLLRTSLGGPYTTFSITFPKRRNDTRLRIFYSSVLGRYHGDRSWACFHVSILVNESQCADPAPMRTNLSGYPSFSGPYDIRTPTTVSGICNSITAGAVALSVHLGHEGSCKGGMSDNEAKGSAITATMHVDELCPET